MSKIFQAIRNRNIYANHDAAISAITSSTFLANRKDGETILARYTDNDGDISTLLGTVFSSGSTTGITIHDVENFELTTAEALSKLRTSAGFDRSGDFVSNPASERISGVTNLTTAINAVDLNIPIIKIVTALPADASAHTNTLYFVKQ
jgi:hypothetical protein